MPTEIFYGPVYEQLPFAPSGGISGYWTGEDGLGHVVYFVEDYEEAKRFYTSTMGFKISDRIVWDGGEKDATFFTVTPAPLAGSDAAFWRHSTGYVQSPDAAGAVHQ